MTNRVIPIKPVMPVCWDSQGDWEAWNTFNQSAGRVHGKLAHYCTDCTPAHQAIMKQENRCGHPDTKFVKIPNTTLFYGVKK